jgi:hypothetical protein
MPLLDDYIAQLATVHNSADLNGPHADWIWDRRSDVTETVAGLNQALGFAGASRFQPHLLTTSVGDASGLLFVSANPGWRLIPNAKEDAFRRISVEANRKFCSDFFTVFRREVGGNGWWSRALLLAHLVQFGAPALGQPMVVPKQRWAWRRLAVLRQASATSTLFPCTPPATSSAHSRAPT